VFSTTIVAMFVAAAATPMLPRWTAVTPSWFHFQLPAAVTVAEPSLSPALADDATSAGQPTDAVTDFNSPNRSHRLAFSLNLVRRRGDAADAICHQFARAVPVTKVV
jgi:hypothetical protein